MYRDNEGRRERIKSDPFMSKLKYKIRLKELQIKEKELDFKIKNTPKKYVEVFHYPLEHGGYVSLQLPEGYTKEDFKKGLHLLKEALSTATIVDERELSLKEKRELLGLN